jgi:hypothetical protein
MYCIHTFFNTRASAAASQTAGASCSVRDHRVSHRTHRRVEPYGRPQEACTAKNRQARTYVRDESGHAAGRARARPTRRDKRDLSRARARHPCLPFPGTLSHAMHPYLCPASQARGNSSSRRSRAFPRSARGSPCAPCFLTPGRVCLFHLPQHASLYVREVNPSSKAMCVRTSQRRYYVFLRAQYSY